MVAANIQFNTPQIGVIVSGDTYALSSNVPDVVSIFWNSADAIAKTMTLYSPSQRVTRNKITVKDKQGTAGTYPITITVDGGGTIEGSSSYIIAYDYMAVTFENDGLGNYAIVATNNIDNVGTFASKPTNPPAGTKFFANDLGGGIEIIYTGTKWKPVNGRAVIHCDGVARTGAGTGAEANYASVLIPAGLVSATGALYLEGQMTATGTAGGKTVSVRHNTTQGATSGGSQVINNNFGGSSTTLSLNFTKLILANNATNAQSFLNTGFGGYGAASSTGIISGSIDMNAASYLNFNVNGNAADTVGYQGIIVEWIEH